MGFGVKEPVVAEGRIVPGTVYLYEHVDEQHPNSESLSRLKHSGTGLVLSPQPTTSPNDPLVSFRPLRPVRTIANTSRIGQHGRSMLVFSSWP